MRSLFFVEVRSLFAEMEKMRSQHSTNMIFPHEHQSALGGNSIGDNYSAFEGDPEAVPGEDPPGETVGLGETVPAVAGLRLIDRRIS